MSGIENGGQKIDSSEGLNNQNDLQKTLSKFKDFEGFNEFTKMLETRDDKKEILSIFSNDSNKSGLESYLLLNGFPPDEESIKDFKKEFPQTDKLSYNVFYKIKGEIQESEVKTQESEVKTQESEVKTQESEVKTQESEVKTQESEVKTQESEEDLKELKKQVGVFAVEITKLKDNSVLKSIPRFNELITRLEETAKSGNSESNDKAKEDIIKFLNDGNNLQIVLETAKKSGDTQYNNILSSITYFAEGNPELAQKLNKWNETIEKASIKENESSIIRQTQTREFFNSNLHGPIQPTGKGYRFGDKEIDFSSLPPKAYLRSENGYKLETKLPRIPKEFNEKRRDWQKRRDGLKKDFEREKNSFDLKEAELKDFEKDFPEPRELWAEEKFQTMKNDLLVIDKNLTKIHDDIVAIDTEMRQFFSKIEFDDKEERKQKEYEKREVLKFISSIGFDRIPQNKLQTILDFININPQTYGLDEKIDLENGVLGFNRDFGAKNINSAEKKAFIKLFNRMLGENIVDENIAIEGKTNLSPKAILRIQVLSNKTTGFFTGNLGKREETK
ncbi:MAG: hypothetical protein PHI37_02855 [Candidatus Gracilibacteria bacterium]|nr:hypothetical protein [Candidatus Gracilibacteria bacterium]